MGFEELQNYSCFPMASLPMPKGKTLSCTRKDAPCHWVVGNPGTDPGADMHRGAWAPQLHARDSDLSSYTAFCQDCAWEGAKARNNCAFSHSFWNQGRIWCHVVPGPVSHLESSPGSPHGRGQKARVSRVAVMPRCAPIPGTALVILGTLREVSPSHQDTGNPAQVRSLALLSPPVPQGRRSSHQCGFTWKQPIMVAQSG